MRQLRRPKVPFQPDWENGSRREWFDLGTGIGQGLQSFRYLPNAEECNDLSHESFTCSNLHYTNLLFHATKGTAIAFRSIIVDYIGSKSKTESNILQSLAPPACVSLVLLGTFLSTFRFI